MANPYVVEYAGPVVELELHELPASGFAEDLREALYIARLIRAIDHVAELSIKSDRRIVVKVYALRDESLSALYERVSRQADEVRAQFVDANSKPMPAMVDELARLGTQLKRLEQFPHEAAP